MKIHSVEITRPSDMHVHLRQGIMLSDVTPFTAQHFKYAVVMPNTTPAIANGTDAIEYQEEIKRFSNYTPFVPLMTIKLTDLTDYQTITSAPNCVVAAKLYPEGVTTNSEDGVKSVKSLYPVFEAMTKRKLVLCVHGETPGVFCLDREESFLETLSQVALDFPELRIVMEHITTEAAVRTVKALSDNVAATITVHHLYLTLDDVIGGKIKPHNFCKPIAKREGDRLALLDAATSGNPKFFLGTDSAPHKSADKCCSEGCAGVFTAPVAMACLAELFEEHSDFNTLELFASVYGPHFYGLPKVQEKLFLTQEEWEVPPAYDSIVPFRAGETLRWRAIPTSTV